MHVEDVIKRPLYLTEKGAKLREEENKYTFEVDLDANKLQIKTAVETLFKVTVDDVHTLIMRGHMRRMGRGFAKTRNWKKAVVTLREGETIDFFEGA
ncbi:MAG: 50S ribosomal protein L23 [Myxococcales bacterium]|nr:50S ribosomal protein L23 [Myxococcales bacterium]MDH3482737.1 50S ribosomal protein L23 [Myxococcales bacterium]MDH3624261.1 50S ribosomal protein L23 [Myxococcales bacterium]MDH3845294.1 50S ribosomal protein L23 [Myxococcales bacterium]